MSTARRLFWVRAILALNAAVHLYYGVVFAWDPGDMMQTLSLAATGPAGITEMRAFHGGLMIAMGCLFAAAALSREWVRAGLIMMTVTYAGAVAARTLGIVIDAATEAVLFQILAIEVAGLLLGFIGLRVVRRRT